MFVDKTRESFYKTNLASALCAAISAVCSSTLTSSPGTPTLTMTSSRLPHPPAPDRGVSFVSLELAKTGLVDQCATSDAHQGGAAFLANTHQCARLAHSQVSLSIIFILISILTINLPPPPLPVPVPTRARGAGELVCMVGWLGWIGGAPFCFNE